MLTSMMCVQKQGGGGKLEFDVIFEDGIKKKHNLKVKSAFFYGGDITDGNISSYWKAAMPEKGIGSITPSNIIKEIYMIEDDFAYIVFYKNPFSIEVCQFTTEAKYKSGDQIITEDWLISGLIADYSLTAGPPPFSDSENEFHLTIYPKK